MRICKYLNRFNSMHMHVFKPSLDLTIDVKMFSHYCKVKRTQRLFQQAFHKRSSNCQRICQYCSVLILYI